MDGKALLIHQSVSANIKPENIVEPKAQTLSDKLIKAMMRKQENVIKWLDENDPGLLIQWNDRVCKTCSGAKKNWAKKVINSNPEIKNIIGDK